MAATVKVGVQTTFDAAGTAAAKVALGQVGAEATKADKALLSYASTTARLQQSAGNASAAEKTLASALSQVDQTSKQALSAHTQLASAQNAVAKAAGNANGSLAVLPRTFAGLTEGVTSAITGFASLGAALGVAKSVVDSFADAFKFKAELDATTASINAQLNGVRDTSVVYAQAATFAQKYKLTQQETTQAISGSIGVMRASKASVEDILGVLGRLQVLSPEQSLEEAAVAVKALASGDTTSLVTRFEVSRDAATSMKNAIVGGKDAVKVLSDYLDKSGIGMDALAAKTKGAAGELKDVAIAQEELKLAQAEWAAGPGKAFLEEQTTLLRGLTRVLGGSGGVSEGLETAAANWKATIAQQHAWNDALSEGKSKQEAAAAGEQAYADSIQATGEAAAKAKADVTAQTAAATAGDAAYQAEIQRSGDVLAANAAYEQAHAASLQQSSDAAIANAAATQQATAAAAAHASTIPATATAINDGTTATNTATAALQAHAAEYLAVSAVTEQSVQVSLADAAAKQEVALKTQLLTAETNAAVGAFMALNPNIDAGGVAALVMAGKIDPLLGQLIQARLRAIEATNAIIAFNNQANIKAVNATVAAGRARNNAGSVGGGGGGRGDSSDAAEANAAAKTRTDAIAAARQQQILTAGTTAQKRTALQQQYNDAVKAHGTESAEAINAQTKLLQATEKGGAARASAADKAATRMENLEGSTSEKIQKIVADRDKKLADLDAKFATEQLENKRKLANDIANTAGNRRVSNEVDDLDLIGKHTPDEARKLNDRERAEADARKRSEANAEEARKKAEEGDAESADKILQIREDANKQQEDLDRAYYEKQAELGKNPELQAALQQQYEEAQKAIQEQSDREVQQANDLAELKKAQREKEHDEIIAAAQDAANVAIGHAQRMADSIIKATGTAGDQGSNNIKKIGDAVNAIPANKTVTVTIKQEGSTSTGGSSSGGTKAAGGGNFISTGPTTLTVGDNPGGRELVTVTPLSGTGHTSVGPGMVKMAGGGVLDAGGGYTTPVATGSNEGTKKVNASKAADAIKSQIEQQRDVIALLTDLIKLRGDLEAAANQQPFNMGLINGLAKKAALFLQIVQSNLLPITKKQGEAFGLYVDAAKDAISILGDVAGLRHDLQENANDQPFDVGLIRGLAGRAALFLGIVQAQLVPISEAQSDALSRYQDAVSTSVSILKDVADLRKELSDFAAPPIDMALATMLAGEAKQVTEIVQGVLLPLTEAQGKAFSAWNDAASASISIVKDASDLSKTLQENGNAPISMEVVTRLAGEAKRVEQIVEGALLPVTEDQTKALSQWADAVGSGVSVIKDVSDLGKTLKEDEASPVDMRRVAQLAGEAKRVTQVVQGQLLPLTEAQGAAFSTWGDAVGASVGVIKDVSDLGRSITEGAGYPISAASIQKLAGDAVRITRTVQGTLLPTTEAQADALSTWGNAVGASVGALRSVTDLSGNLFADYTSPSDSQLNRLAADAKRVTDAMGRAVATYSTTGIAAGQAYAESVGATFTAFKDGLLFFEALNSGDYNLNVGALRKFEAATVQTLGVVKRLGAEAIKIPAANIAALGVTTQALTSQSEALIKLAAVPFGDIQPAAAGLAAQANTLLNGASRGGGTVNNYNTFNLPQGTTQQLAAEVIKILNARTGAHR